MGHRRHLLHHKGVAGAERKLLKSHLRRDKAHLKKLKDLGVPVLGLVSEQGARLDEDLRVLNQISRLDRLERNPTVAIKHPHHLLFAVIGLH